MSYWDQGPEDDDQINVWIATFILVMLLLAWIYDSGGMP